MRLRKNIIPGALIITLLMASSVLPSENPSPQLPTNTVIEISDRNYEVKLGLTASTVYMVITEEIKELANTELLNQYRADMQSFDDSQGNFIPTTSSYLSSNRLEFPLNEIAAVHFTNGKLEFDFTNSDSINFSDLHSKDGKSVLDNFYLEDLEAFYLAYKSLVDSKK